MNSIGEIFDDYLYGDKVEYWIRENKSELLDATLSDLRFERNSDFLDYFPNHNNIVKYWIVTLGKKYYVIGVNDRFLTGRRDYKITIICNRFYPEGKPRRKKRHSECSWINNTASTYKNSVNKDCQIRTLATILDTDYHQILELMKMGGWSIDSTGNIYTGDRWNTMLSIFEHKKELVWSKWKTQNINGKCTTPKGMTVATVAKKYPIGKYVIRVKNHVLALVDGVIYDSWNSTTCRVVEIFQISKI